MKQEGMQAGLGIIQDGKCLFLKLTDVEKAIISGVLTQILDKETVVAQLVGIELPEDMKDVIEGTIGNIEESKTAN